VGFSLILSGFLENMSRTKTKDSIFLSLVLRHKPDLVGIKIEDGGWVEVKSLLAKCEEFGRNISFEVLKEIVETDLKQRYSFKDDFQYIRANQGHSIDVDMQFRPTLPPLTLFHGTAEKNIEPIKKLGILRGERQFVHMTKDLNVAKASGARHGDPAVLKVDSSRMMNDGYDFYCSENNVWLTEHVPYKYVEIEFGMSFYV
jgi:putative RNA 2'-phosphotransferase